MRFQVFKNGEIWKDFQLCAAYMFGTDGIPLRRVQLTFKDGVIECQKQNDLTAGLVMLWSVSGFGKVLMPTTCLPERGTDYNLNVEIARAKLMEIVKKCEDWAVFNRAEINDNIYKEAQSLFIEAIQNLSDPPLAAKLADRALEKALIFSEQITSKHSNLLFSARGKSRGFSRGCLGCKMDPRQTGNPSYLENLFDLFSFITIPVNWAKIEAEQGNYDFSEIDNCIDAIGKRRLAVCGGPLLCFTRENIPKWLADEETDFEKIREAAYDFISTIVSKYSSVIRAWRVVSGLNIHNCFGFSFEQVLEITRAATMAVKAANERIVKIIEISNPWSAYYTMMPNTIPALVYMDMILQAAISFEAFGLQLRFGKNQIGMYPRDLMQISTLFDTFGMIAKPLYITELEIPSKKSSANECQDVEEFKEWDENRQGYWIEELYKIAFSKPFVNAVTYSNLTDVDDSMISYSGLMTDKLVPKKSFIALNKIHATIFGK